MIDCLLGRSNNFKLMTPTVHKDLYTSPTHHDHMPSWLPLLLPCPSPLIDPDHLTPTTLFPYKYGQFLACPHSHFITCWRWNRHSVPKHRLLILRRRGNTQKTIYQEQGTLHCASCVCYRWQMKLDCVTVMEQTHTGDNKTSSVWVTQLLFKLLCSVGHFWDIHFRSI
jgi:hypothetical protein